MLVGAVYFLLSPGKGELCRDRLVEDRVCVCVVWKEKNCFRDVGAGGASCICVYMLTASEMRDSSIVGKWEQTVLLWHTARKTTKICVFLNFPWDFCVAMQITETQSCPFFNKWPNLEGDLIVRGLFQIDTRYIIRLQRKWKLFQYWVSQTKNERVQRYRFDILSLKQARVWLSVFLI